MSFEDLGGEENSDSDKLMFGGTPVCVPVTKTFNIQNRTSQSQKFEWPKHDSVGFVPRVGHLLPHSSKQITATFESKKKLELVGDKVELSLKVIEHTGEVVDWDESSTTVSWVAVGKDGTDSLENTGTSQSSPKRRGNKKVVEPTPEPEFTIKEGSEQNVPLLISANSDALVYELGTDSIKLKSTMMFQTRAFSFPFKNTSTVPLAFSWAFEKDSEDPWEVAAQDGSEPVPLPDPFVVEPATGTVAPGQSINVQVHFSPQEAGSYSRRLIAKIPHLDTRQPTNKFKITTPTVQSPSQFGAHICDHIGRVLPHCAASLHEQALHGRAAPVTSVTQKHCQHSMIGWWGSYLRAVHQHLD